MRTLMQVSAFYKNDTRTGIGITLTFEIGDLDRIVFELKTSYDAMWRQSVIESETAQLTKGLFGQLEFIGKARKPISVELSLAGC